MGRVPPPACRSRRRRNLQPAEQTLAVGATSTITVTLNAAQTTPTVVTLSVDAASVLQVPPSVTVPQNQINAAFTVTGLAVGEATVTATVNGSSRTALVHVVPPPPVAVSLLPATQAIQQGATGTLIFTLTPIQLGNTTVALTTSDPTVLQVPPSVTVPAGQNQAPIAVTGLVPGGPVTITATLGGVTVSAQVTVTPPPTLVTGITPATLTLPKGRPGTLRVTVSPAPTMATDVTLTSSDTSHVVVPPMVAVPAGALFADFVVMTPGEGSATVTATLNGSSATATVTVTPAEVVTLTLSPQNPAIFVGETQQFTATGTFTDGTTQTLTTQVTWTSSNETVATINSGGLATALAVGTTTITASYLNPSGPPPITVSTELTVQTPPALQVIPSTASLQVGENVSLTLNIGAPAGANGLTVMLTSTGSGSITHPATVTFGVGEVSMPFAITGATAGSVTLTATAIGRQPAVATLTVTPATSISSFTPTSGPVGTTVTITGQNFDPVAASNQVKFNGKPAIVSAATATSITTTVPQGAITGPITVTTSLNTATSATNFTVELSQNFTLSAAPTLTPVLQGGQGSYALSVAAVGNFTGLVTLGVTGVPAGVAATFTSPTLTAGQTAYLTVTAGAAVPAGPVTFSLTGTTQLETGTSTQTIPLTLQVQASAGQTAVSGQFLNTVTGAPIPNVQVTLAGMQAQSNAAGQFLLIGVPSGTQTLMIDANVAVAGFPIYNVAVTLSAGQTNVLPSLRIMPSPPPERFTPINNATANQIITDPRFPGVEITLPAGAVITGWQGDIKNKVAIERLMPDQLPVPPPPGPTRSVFQLFFGTPMGGVPSTPIPVTLPNDLDLDPGEKAELWYYDASPTDPGQWRLAGMGTVSVDGAKIISDPGVGIQRFCGACGLPCFINRQQKQPNRNPSGPEGADPVDLATGIMAVDKTDMVLPGRLPVVLSRSYNPFDAFGTIGGFQPSMGPGWYLSVDTILIPPSFQTSLARLVLPGNARLDLAETLNSTFVNGTHPLLQGAVATIPAASSPIGGTIRFKDGTIWKFQRVILTGALGETSFDYLAEVNDRNGNRITIERSSNGRINRIVDSAGRILTVTYTGPKISEIRDPLGRTVRYSYDTNGRLASVTDPASGVTQYTYDSAGRILSITDARGIQYIQNFYGPSGRVLRQVLADGAEWRVRYKVTGATITGPSCTINPQIVVFPPPPACPPNSEDSWENFQAGYSFQGGAVTATTIVDPSGNATVHQFTSNGFESAVANALGQMTRFERDAKGNLLSSTDALGQKTTFTLDAIGNITTITDPAGNVARFEYEPTFNRVTKITDAINRVTEFTYDAKGNRLTSKNPLNQVTTITYNQFGQPLTVTDALNHTTTFAYDANGNLVTTADPLGNITQRAYDTVSRLSALTDPRGATSQFTYDALSRATQITDALNGLTQFTYDPNGNLLTVADANSQTTTYTYDSMDRLATRKDALNRTETHQYDPAGNLSQFTDRKNQVTTFTYDSLNRRIGASYADGSSTSFIYDSVGRLTRATDSLVGAIEFVYDNLDRLSKEISAQGVVEYAYDALGRRTTMTANGATPVSYGYDAASRLIQVAQAGLVVGLGYDNASRRTSLTYPNGTSTSYSYDNASRVTAITHNGPVGLIESLSYVYDAAGNRISLTRTNGTVSNLPAAVQAVYDAANEQITFNSLPSTFDANGNQTTSTDASGTTTYTWDARNRLVAIAGPGVTANFTYDAIRRRVSKTINGVTTQFLYDGKDIVQEIGESAVGASYVRSLRIDEPFVRQTSTGNEFYHVDALGSTLALSSAAGASVVNYSYEPFGKTTITGASSNPFQFTGRENDGAGLYYYRARYYSPTLHRFVRPDPLGLNGGSVNLYQYVLDNPVNQVDPDGRAAFLIDALIQLLKELFIFPSETAKDQPGEDDDLDNTQNQNDPDSPICGKFGGSCPQPPSTPDPTNSTGPDSIPEMGTMLPINLPFGSGSGGSGSGGSGGSGMGGRK